jgi:hypothetical protein
MKTASGKQRPARQTEAERVAAQRAAYIRKKNTVRTTAKEAALRAYQAGRSTFTVVFNGDDTLMADVFSEAVNRAVAGTTRKLTTVALQAALSKSYAKGYRQGEPAGHAAGKRNVYVAAEERSSSVLQDGDFDRGYLMGYVTGYRDAGGQRYNDVKQQGGNTGWQPWAGIPSGEAGVVSKQLPERCQWRRPQLTEGGDYVNKKDTFTVWGSARVTT